MISKQEMEVIAKVAHNVNKACCEAIGDVTQVDWDEAPEWQKESAIDGIRAHLETTMTHQESHESWVSYKVSEGWVWGPIKDAERKQHPCIVPYEELPAEQKMKDVLFKAVADTMIESLVEKKEKEFDEILVRGLDKYEEAFNAMANMEDLEVYKHKALVSGHIYKLPEVSSGSFIEILKVVYEDGERHENIFADTYVLEEQLLLDIDAGDSEDYYFIAEVNATERVTKEDDDYMYEDIFDVKDLTTLGTPEDLR